MPGGKRKKLGALAHSKGVTFSVWAPLAKHVAVAVPYISYDTSNQVAMERDKDGIWSVTVPHAEVGHYYKYIITTNRDEVVERNDPRARTVEVNSDGGSQSVIVSNDFDWGDDFLMPIPKEQQVIYELHVGTFNRPDPATQGTFFTAIEKLDYLADLGINMIELMPITSMSSGNGWGYDVHSIFSVENSYGGRHGLMTFVKECHKRGIGVIADVVYNHFSNAEIWQFDGWTDEYPAGYYFWGDHRRDTPWGARPDFSRKEVRNFLLDSVAMWMNEYRMDGLRFDSTSYLRSLEANEDKNAEIPGAWSFLQAATELVRRIRPGCCVIAEDTSENEWITKSKDSGGAGFDAQWRLAFPVALYRQLGIQDNDGVDLKYELSHTYNGDAFSRVIFSDSHDTAANGRARLNEVVAPKRGEDSKAQQELLLASAIVLTTPGIPMLLQGQEFVQDGAFNDWHDLDWNNLETHANIVDAHKDLIQLRRNDDAITAGLVGASIALFHTNDKDHVVGYHRWDQGGVGDDTIVIAHFGDTAFPRYDVVLPIAGTWQYCFDSRNYIDNEPERAYTRDTLATSKDGAISISLHPRQVIVLTRVS